MKYNKNWKVTWRLIFVYLVKSAQFAKPMPMLERL